VTSKEQRLSRPASLNVSGEVTLRGTRMQDVVVSRGGVLWIQGVVIGRLTVLAGGRAHVQGQVEGDVYLAGRLTVRGRVSGTVITASTAVVRLPDTRGAIDGGVRRLDEAAT
jgi:cytoskeletal protein CcmA (bactofilin family)